MKSLYLDSKVNRLTDEQLMERLQQGYSAALDELYRRYAKKLYTFCFHTLNAGNRQSAEDVVHDVFIRVIKSARTFDPQKALFRTWLFSIARNHCIDLGRRQARIRFLPLVRRSTSAEEREVDRGENLPDPAEPVEDSVSNKATLAAVRECIQALQNQDERQAILLYYMAGKVLREIGQVLGKSTSTAKNRLESAQVKVRRCLEDKGIDSTF
jgi:RNA polymerase sigma-70 factor (ECF subfamily)